jgi:acyl-coenzyme A synthetase/AMP-(fatty) acid ligase
MEVPDKLDCVEKVVVFLRSGAEHCAPRKIDFNELLAFPPHGPAEEMDAEDPLFPPYLGFNRQVQALEPLR